MRRISKSFNLLSSTIVKRCLTTSGERLTPGISFKMTQDQAEMVDMAEKFTKEEITPAAAKYDKSGEFPWDIVRKAHNAGLMNLHVPEEYGGLGINVMDGCLIGEKLTYGCSGITMALAGNFLASAPLILAATHHQKKKYLGRTDFLQVHIG